MMLGVAPRLKMGGVGQSLASPEGAMFPIEDSLSRSRLPYFSRLSSKASPISVFCGTVDRLRDKQRAGQTTTIASR